MEALTYLFLHVPKAAGTTLSQVVERHVPARAQYRLGANAQAAIEAFNHLSPSEKSRFRLLSGHFPFGVHEQIPGPCAYFTMLREPVDRVASFYHFILRDPLHPLHQAMTPAQKASLEVYARTARDTVMDNGQTRQLAGDWGHVPFGECSEAMLEQAKANLDQMRVVGLTERFDASLMLLGHTFGWHHLGYRRANTTQGRPPKSALDDATREALIARNTYDLALYAYAEKKFEAQWHAAGLRETEFSRLHPPPGPCANLLWKLRSRTPKEWLKKAFGR